MINSKAEQQAIGSIIPNNQNSWIGLCRNPKDKSRFLWVDKSPVSYTHWYRGEPSSLQEGCVHMNSQAHNLGWNDLRCTNKLPYLCEANERGKGFFCCMLIFVCLFVCLFFLFVFNSSLTAAAIQLVLTAFCFDEPDFYILFIVSYKIVTFLSFILSFSLIYQNKYEYFLPVSNTIKLNMYFFNFLTSSEHFFIIGGQDPYVCYNLTIFALQLYCVQFGTCIKVVAIHFNFSCKVSSPYRWWPRQNHTQQLRDITGEAQHQMLVLMSAGIPASRSFL